MFTKEIKEKDCCLVIDKDSHYYYTIVQITEIVQTVNHKLYFTSKNASFWREDLIPIIGTKFRFTSYDNDIMGEQVTLPAIGISKDFLRVEFDGYSVYPEGLHFEEKDNKKKNKLFNKNFY